MNDVKNLAASYFGIAYLYKEIRKFDSSFYYFTEGIKAAKATNSPINLLDGYRGITDLSYQLKDYKSAYDYHLKYTALKDSLFNETNSQNIAELTTKYETEQKEKEIQFLTTEKEKNRLIRNYLLVFLFFVAVIAGLLYFLYLAKTKENKRRRDSEAKIQELNRTLEARVKEEVAKLEKQQILLMQKSKLESLGSFPPELRTKSINL